MAEIGRGRRGLAASARGGGHRVAAWAGALALTTGVLTAAVPADAAPRSDCGALRWLETSPGSGVWQVPDAAHLACLAGRTDVSDPLGLSYLQTAPLDLSGVSPWRPIGGAGPQGAFWGAYDGGGLPISGLNLDVRVTDDAVAGLFGVVDATGLLRGVVVTGATVSATSTAGSASAGLLAGRSDGQIVGSSASGTVSATAVGGASHAGGLVGDLGRATAAAAVSGSTAAAGVSASGRAAVAGGLVGYVGVQGGVVDTSSASGDVTASGGAQARAGGLLGEAAMTAGGGVAGSGATGRVRAALQPDLRAAPPGTEAAPSSVAVGGLVGMAYLGPAGITDSYATGAVLGAGEGTASAPATGTVDAGGLVGWNQGDVAASFATGSVRAEGTGTRRAGGLVGYHFAGAVSDTYATGSVDVRGPRSPSWAGGLLGVNGFGDGTVLRHSYATGLVTASDTAGAEVGGLVGGRGTAPVEASFWDSQSSQIAPASPPDPVSAGTPATTADLLKASTYRSAGWSLATEQPVPEGSTWGICDGRTRPYLAWQRFAADPCTGSSVPTGRAATITAPAVRATAAAPSSPEPSAPPVPPAAAPTAAAPSVTPSTSARAATPSDAAATPSAAAPSDAAPSDAAPSGAAATPSAATSAPGPAPAATTAPAPASVRVATPLNGSAVSSGGWFGVTATTAGTAAGTTAYVTVDGIAVASAKVGADGSVRFGKVPSRVGQYRVRIGPAPATVQSDPFTLDVRPFAISYATAADGTATITIRTGNWYRGQVLALTRDHRVTATVRVGKPGAPVILKVPALTGDYQVKAQSRQGVVYGMAAGELRLR